MAGGKQHGTGERMGGLLTQGWETWRKEAPGVLLGPGGWRPVKQKGLVRENKEAVQQGYKSCSAGAECVTFQAGETLDGATKRVRKD